MTEDHAADDDATGQGTDATAGLELEDLYDLSIPGMTAVSPDGDRVAFLASEADPDEDRRGSSLFVAPTDGSRDPHRLTRASDASRPKWSPDGRRLGFVAARDEDVARKVGRNREGETDEDADDDEDEEAPDGPGGEGPKPQVWAFDVELGGDAVQVTDFDDGAREFDWAPDGDRMVVGARDPTDEQAAALKERRDGGPIEIERLYHKSNGGGWHDDVTRYLFVVDVETGRSERLDDAHSPHGLGPAWGANDRIAFTSNRTERPDDSGVADVYTIDPDGGNLRKLTDSDLRAGRPVWSPDGERLAFGARHPRNPYVPTELFVCDPGPDPATDPDGEGVEYRSVTGSWLLAGRGGGPSWLDDDTLLATLGDEGHTRLGRIPADRADPEPTFPAQTRDRDMWFTDADGGTVAVVLSDPAEGEDVWTVDVADLDDEDPASLRRVSALNDGMLAGAALPECRRVTWENSDGVGIEGFVYLPPTFDPGTDDPLPVVASIHGGPFSYDAPEFRFEYAYWTGQGYALYRTNFRGSTSYGREFAERLRGTRGDLETDDVVTGLAVLAERGWVDPDRAFVTGYSFGGTATAGIVTMVEDPFAAAAAEGGIYDYRSTFGTDDNHLKHEWEFGLPWEEPETYETVSPITDVDDVDTPLLITAGEHDWRCPPSQAEQLYVSLRKRDATAKLVVYQDEPHRLPVRGPPERAIHRLETLGEWFREHDPGIETGEGPGEDADDASPVEGGRP